MLKQLHIQHLILIEKAEIPFDSGLNVLSGETGSGKSAVLEALALIMGERADTGIIRKGFEKGSAEGIFELPSHSPLFEILADGGIEADPKEELIFRRDIYATGKSRAFINNQPAQLAFFKKIGEHLIKFVGQHASQLFLNLDNHRCLLDDFGCLQEDLKIFSQSFKHKQQLQERLLELKSTESQRIREIERAYAELDEIDSAKIKEGEEEEVFSEYTRLSHGEEIQQKTESLIEALSGEKNSVLSLIARLKQLFEKLVQLDSSLDDSFQTFQECAVSLQEITYTLGQYQSRIDCNPERVHLLNERLSLLSKLKKKYGATLEHVLEYANQLRLRLHELENADNEIEQLEKDVQEATKKSDDLAKRLSEKRAIAAKQMAEEIVNHLKVLNMPKVEFHVQLTPQKRSATGDEKVEFFMAPNIGEKLISIRECASGGELSRLTLAIQAVMAGKEQIPILLFDEVDANIGGETAAVVAEKLAEISQSHQLICITHFPQVASRAHHHLQISKKEVEGRTLSVVKILTPEERQAELSRMVGHRPS